MNKGLQPLNQGPGDPSKFLRGDGTWQVAAVFPMFGDGSDGDVTISGGTTLSRAMCYNSLVIASGGTLSLAGFPVQVKGALTVQSGGKITADGLAGNANGNATGNLYFNSIFGAPGIGGAGNTGAGSAGGSGAADSTVSILYPAANLSYTGGTGGNGTSGSGAAGGTATTSGGIPTTPAQSWPTCMTGVLISRNVVRSFCGAPGGGGGSGDATNKGGGGGGGGGVLMVSARTISNSGTISANGGTGGTPATGNCGGGGGGCGGAIFLNYLTFTGSAATASAGTHGSGVGSGTNGADGSAGVVYSQGWS